MAPLKTLIDTVYLPGRPVKLKPGLRPPGVPRTEICGIILKAIEMPDGQIQVYVEWDAACNIPPRLHAKDDIELLGVSEDILRKNLSGRKVHFPRSSGIGIKVPKEAGDYAEILAANYRDGKLTISMGFDVELENGTKTIKVVLGDFTHCDLVPCTGKKDDEC